MPAETSIIIRTRNEEKWLGAVLEKLFRQTYKNFEVIIVDSGSSDRTLEIAEKFPVKILKIPYEKFSYPFALNYGIKNSLARSFIVIISGHSVPISNTWLENGLEDFLNFKNLMGVYGPLRPLPNASFWDEFFMIWRRLFEAIFCKRRIIVKKARMGVLGFTNAIIRKDLLDLHNFNEDYGLGGEDGEWARYWFARGFIAIKDKKFAVFHFHNLGLVGWYRQWKYWKSLGKPQPFRSLSFRKDKTHSG